MQSVALAPGLRAIVRDWLDANHVLVTRGGECVLIDTGCSVHAERTLALLRAPEALGGRRLDRIINTHCHSDHMGGNAAIARTFGAPISVPLDAAPAIDAWDTRELLLDYADQYAERFAYTDTIAPNTVLRTGDLEWLAVAAPGHDMGALAFYAPEHRVLVSGDALWQSGFGLIEPIERLEERLGAQRATLERIAALDVAWVVPGHGAPFTDAGAALERAFQRLEAYAADPLKLASYCVKVLFMFALLARGQMQAAEVPADFGRVPCYRDYNERFFRLAPAALAQNVVEELVTAGAVELREGALVPRR